MLINLYISEIINMDLLFGAGLLTPPSVRPEYYEHEAPASASLGLMHSLALRARKRRVRNPSVNRVRGAASLACLQLMGKPL